MRTVTLTQMTPINPQMTSTLVPLAVGLCLALTSMTSVQSAVTSLSTLQVLNTTGHPQLLQLIQLANLTQLFDNGGNKCV